MQLTTQSHSCPLPVIDLEPLWHSGDISEAVTAIAQRIDDDLHEFGSVGIIPLLTGAMVFAVDLMAALEQMSPGKWIMNPVFSSTYGDGFKPGNVEMMMSPAFAERAKSTDCVLILDDLIDTGRSMKSAAEVVEAISGSPVLTAVLVEKANNSDDYIPADYSAFTTLEERWLVGYGMDLSGRYRGLPCIGAYSQPDRLIEQI